MNAQAAPEARMVPWPLITLTVTTGMVDAICYLKLGHVFVANMTGNVVLLGFALAGARDISAFGSLVAMAAFLVGALAGGRLVRQSSDHAHLLFQATLTKFVLGLAALAVATFVAVTIGSPGASAVIALLGLAMGVQNAIARKMAVPDFTTTVLTLTLTGMAADITAGANPKIVRRLTSVVAMFAGALLGAALVLKSGVLAGLAGVTAFFALTFALVVISPTRRFA